MPSNVKRLAAVVTVSLAALFSGSSEAAPRLQVGTADFNSWGASWADWNIYWHNQVGMRVHRASIFYGPGKSSLTAEDIAYLDRVYQLTEVSGISLLVTVANVAAGVPQTEAHVWEYGYLLQEIVRRYPYIEAVEVWNEPNSPDFWPRDVGWYVILAAHAYDAVKQVNIYPRVAGPGTAPAHDPRAFIRAMGDMYRWHVSVTGRVGPLFDIFTHHPYPKYDGESVEATHPYFTGLGDHVALRAAIRDGFSGTNQLLPGPHDWLGERVPIWYTEYGSGLDGISELEQAKWYQAAIREAYCQPYVEALIGLQILDQGPEHRWQAGFVRSDWGTKPAASHIREQISLLPSVQC